MAAAFNMTSRLVILNNGRPRGCLCGAGDPSTWYATDPSHYNNREQLTHQVTATLDTPTAAGEYRIAQQLGPTAAEPPAWITISTTTTDTISCTALLYSKSAKTGLTFLFPVLRMDIIALYLMSGVASSPQKVLWHLKIWQRKNTISCTALLYSKSAKTGLTAFGR